MGAGKDLDERRLAGAVLAEQGDDLSWRDREADIVERPHAGEQLGQVLRDEDGLIREPIGHVRRSASILDSNHWSAPRAGYWQVGFLSGTFL